VGTLIEKQQVVSSYEVATDGIYDLFGTSDVVLTTYSSVGMEAVARGYPVICLLLPNIVNASPILDIDTPGVVTVTNDEELDDALKFKHLSTEKNGAELSTAVQYFFGELDGRADKRWADVIISVGDSANALVSEVDQK